MRIRGNSTHDLFSITMFLSFPAGPGLQSANYPTDTLALSRSSPVKSKPNSLPTLDSVLAHLLEKPHKVWEQ